MILSAAIPLLLALGADPAPRLLLCRPAVSGEPALARAEALPAAARSLGSRFLDYGVACEGEAEAGRAAARAGLPFGVAAQAEGRGEGSRYALVLAGADERAVARRVVEVPPGVDPVPPLRRTLEELYDGVPGARDGRVGPWIAIGAGAAALVASAACTLAARSAAADRDRAGEAGDASTYVSRDAAWRRYRAVAIGAGAAGVAALGLGLTWKLAF